MQQICCYMMQTCQSIATNEQIDKYAVVSINTQTYPLQLINTCVGMQVEVADAARQEAHAGQIQLLQAQVRCQSTPVRGEASLLCP